MTTSLYRICALGFIFLSALILSASLVFAQQGEGVDIRPAIIEDQVDAGGTYHYSIQVRNIADTEKLLYLVAQDIKGADDGGRPIFSEEGEKTPYEMSTWISFNKRSLNLKPGEETTVPFTVRVPADATPGSHFGSILLASDPPKLTQSGAGVGFRVGNIISLRISGDAVEEMRLRELSTERLVYGAPPVTFNMRTENLGNVLLRPHGLIEITDMFGKQVASIEVNATAGAVFPAAERTYTATWESEDLAFGRYQAIASLVYGDQVRKTISASTSFWVLPLKLIAITLGSLLLVVLALYMSVKLYIRKKLADMGVTPGDRGAEYYAKKYQRSSSRLVFVALSVFICCVALLVVLFLLFA